MHAQRMVNLTFALLLAASTLAAQQSVPDSKGFSFTSVDLELLEKSNQLDKQLQEKGLVFNDPDTIRYITKVGRDVLPAGPELQSVHWQFFVLRDPTPNAFALPNGSIYVHTGLLALLDNEAQLAGVLAHEETHVLNRHGYIENRSYRKKAEAGIILAGATSAGRLAAGFGEGIALSEASLVVQLAIPAILNASINGYSRELEQEADLHAVRSVDDAGYSAGEIGMLFSELQQEHDVDLSRKGFYQDHPKLQDRSNYVAKLAASLPSRSTPPAIEADRYLLETEAAVRHDAELEIRAGRARTAVWAMERIVKRDDKLAENFAVLGDAYRGLGPRTPVPAPQEITDKGKDKARKMISKMTPQEYEAELLKAPGGQQTLESNEQLAETNYKKALRISPDLPEPYRGLGLLYEEEHRGEESEAAYRKYLELSPSAADSTRIRRRLDSLEKGTAIPSQPAGSK